ncbi:MAG: SMC-Scp complex subunit ScpB [Candidatus Caenarcaniphilales bacterium]|nr:SMC-Scp complex subunit ScpB [Candidatus Caenarcaniphilales bacterium]
MALKQEVEVILFWNNKPLSLSAIADKLLSNPAEVKKALMDLVREYELREGGLQINFRNNGYVMEPKEEYLALAQKVVPIDLKIGELRTLATIALKEPVKQTDIIDIRGSGAYDHIRELSEANWITKEQSGQTYLLRTTPEFKKHFRLSEQGDELKEKLQKILNEIALMKKHDDETSLDDILSSSNPVSSGLDSDEENPKLELEFEKV